MVDIDEANEEKVLSNIWIFKEDVQSKREHGRLHSPIKSTRF